MNKNEIPEEGLKYKKIKLTAEKIQEKRLEEIRAISEGIACSVN